MVEVGREKCSPEVAANIVASWCEDMKCLGLVKHQLQVWIGTKPSSWLWLCTLSGYGDINYESESQRRVTR